MQVYSTVLPEVLHIEPRVFRDERGHFTETWQEARYATAGLTLPFRQDNVSVSRRFVLRGLHAQQPHAQGKLVTVLRGRAFDVAVDTRLGSPRFGSWVGIELDGERKNQLWVPPGFLHGFVALEDQTVFSYKCTEAYEPTAEFSVRWDDPDLNISWPVSAPHVAPKDAAAPLLRDVPRERLLPYIPEVVPA